MGMLDGIRVIDLSRFVSGPFCSMFLGDMGADVMKVEQPGTGDNTRKWAPGASGPDNPYFMSVNRSKRSIVLNLKHPRGIDALLRLAAQSDVLMHNLRPGKLEAMGITFERLQAINPRLILCEVSGYGKSGPDHKRPAFDITIQAESGLMSLIGEPDGPPMKVGAPITDVLTAMTACIGIEGALLARERTGKGTHLRTSMLEAALAAMPNVASEYLIGKVPPLRWGNGHPNIVPYEVFPAADGFITIGVGSERQWKPFCELIGRPDLASDVRYSTNPARLDNRAALIAELKPLIAAQSRAYWRDGMDELGLPCAFVNGLDETLRGPQASALGVVQKVEHPTCGTIEMVCSPLEVDGHYLPINRPPPTLGQHTDEILHDVGGLTQAEIAELRQCGAIG